MASDKIELLRLKKEVWEKAVETQMHFNEMSVKTRQLGLTFVVASLGLAGVLMVRDKNYAIDVFGYGQMHISSLIVLVGAIGIYTVRVLDLNVYHRMLRGAVTFGERLENELREEGLFSVPKGMTQSISIHSRYEVVDMSTMEGTGGRIDARQKIEGFYNLVFCIIIAIAAFVALTTWEQPKEAVPENSTKFSTSQQSVSGSDRLSKAADD